MKRIVFIIFVALLWGCDIPVTESSSSAKNALMTYSIPDNQIDHYRRQHGDGPTICFMGDSRIEMYPIENYFPDKNLINYARSGSMTAGIVHRVDRVNSMNPDIIIISIGINNVKGCIDLFLAPMIPDIISSAKKFRTHNPDVKIYITNIVPAQNLRDGHTILINKLVAVYNEKLKDACLKNDFTYLYLECMESPSGYLSSEFALDIFHYNSKGYDALTEFLKSSIAELN